MGIAPDYNRVCARCHEPLHYGRAFCDKCEAYLEKQDMLEGRCATPSDCKRPDFGCEK